MFGRLRTKLTVLYAGFFALALALVALLVYAAISTNAERAVRDELATSGAVFDRVRELRAEQLRQSAEVLARDFGFREAAATGDAATIGSALDNLRGRSGADIGLMVRPDGTVITGGGARVGDAGPAIVAALQADERAQGVLRIGEDFHQAISAPILSPTLSGWLVFAVRLDERELAALEKLSAIPLEAAVLHRDADGCWSGPGAARGTAEERRTLSRHIDASLKAPRPETLSLADGRSVVLARPLHAMTPQSSAVLVLRYPMARALAPYQALMRTILAIGGLALVLVVVGSWLLASSVSRPLSALERRGAPARARRGGRGPARGRRRGRPAGGLVQRHGAGHPPARAQDPRGRRGAGRGARPGGVGQPRHQRLPGQHEPRDPHPAERGARPVADAGADHAGPGPAKAWSRRSRPRPRAWSGCSATSSTRRG